MPKGDKLLITIKTRSRDLKGGYGPEKLLVLKAEVDQSNLSTHDEVGVLFALEFAANNHAEMPMRVWIHEDHS